MKKEKKKNNHKKKKKVIVIIGISFLVLLGLFCLFYGYQMHFRKTIGQEKEAIQNQNKMALKNEQIEVEYGNTWTYQDFINYFINEDQLKEPTEIKIYRQDTLLQESDSYTYLNVGTDAFKVELSTPYTYKIFKEKTEEIKVEKDYEIQVVDTKAPILSGVEDKTISVGDTLDFQTFISAKDPIDGELKVEIEGEWDSKKAGVYTLKAYAIDKNENRSEQEFKVTVKEKTVKKSTISKKTPSTSNNNNNNSGSSSTCVLTSALRKRGYKKGDSDACSKNEQATKIARQIAQEILAMGYKTDLEKVQKASEIVSSYYSKGIHVESGYDYASAYGVFIKGEASCAGCTRALILILENMGFTNLVHANENAYTHQWVKLTMDGQMGFADGQIGTAAYGCHFVDETC